MAPRVQSCNLQQFNEPVSLKENTFVICIARVLKAPVRFLKRRARYKVARIVQGSKFIVAVDVAPVVRHRHATSNLLGDNLFGHGTKVTVVRIRYLDLIDRSPGTRQYIANHGKSQSGFGANIYLTITIKTLLQLLNLL